MFSKLSVTNSSNASNTSQKDQIALSPQEIEAEREAFFADVQNKNIGKIKQKITSPNFEVWTLTDQNENNVLHRAAFFNSLEIIEILITALKRNFGMEFPKFILTYVNAKNREGDTALHYASFNGNIKIIKYLIELGADLDISNNRGLNVLHFAAQGNQPASLIFFKEKYKLNLDSFDDCGARPLHWACYSNAFQAAEFLMSWEVDVNIRDNEGNTPLHLCVINNDKKLVKLLQQHRVDPMIKNKKGESAITLAKLKHREGILNILEYKRRFELFEVKFPLAKMKKKKTNKVAIYVFVNIVMFAIMLFNILYTFWDNSDYKNKILIFFCGNFGIYNVLYALLYFIDPSVKRNKNIEDSNKTFLELAELGEDIALYCPKCKAKREDNSFHCIICDKCIGNYHHHCFWVNNCVGSKNFLIFILFVFFITVFTVQFVIFGLLSIIYSERSVEWCDKNFCLPLQNTMCIIAILVGTVLTVPLLIYSLIYLKKTCKSVKKEKENKLLGDKKNANISIISDHYTIK